MSAHSTHLIELATEITVAKLSNPSTKSSELTAESISEFIQTVHNKLVELDSQNN